MSSFPYRYLPHIFSPRHTHSFLLTRRKVSSSISIPPFRLQAHSRRPMYRHFRAISFLTANSYRTYTGVHRYSYYHHITRAPFVLDLRGGVPSYIYIYTYMNSGSSRGNRSPVFLNNLFKIGLLIIQSASRACDIRGGKEKDG